MDINALAASGGVALVLSVAANIAQWRYSLTREQKFIDLMISSVKAVADLAAALKESSNQIERLIGDRAR